MVSPSAWVALAFGKVTDVAVAELCKGLPPNLVDLCLSFEGCTQITDRGQYADCCLCSAVAQVSPNC